MNIVVDTNIIFSSILNPNGLIADLLINSESKYRFYSPTFMLKELENHHQKMQSISGLSNEDIAFLKRIVLSNVNLIDVDYIKDDSWKLAKTLTQDIDRFDIPFVALCIELEVPLWTGDKKLTKGLLSKGVDWVLSTHDLINT